MTRTFVRLTGGLGNQLFQIAKAYDLERMNPGSVRLDGGWFAKASRSLQARQWEMDGIDLGLPLRSVPRVAWAPRIGLAQTDVGTPALGRLMKRLSSTDLYDGWWQEYALVERVKAAMLRTFEQARRRSDVAALGVGAVAVHIRLGDYASDAATAQFHGLTDYRQQLQLADEICSRDGLDGIVVFTDSPDQLRLSTHLRSEVVLSDANDAWDALIQMASAGVIVMSNSTLSWWAAYFAANGRSQQPRVLMPYPWFRKPSERDANLFVPGWEHYQRSPLQGSI